jgi:sialate O-acetylesterase
MKLPFLVILLSVSAARAAVQLPAIFSDHMVLRRDAGVPVWGRADPGETVKVTLDGRTVETTADADGRWNVRLDLSQTGDGPFEMIVSASNTVTISDVVVGEVWLASGQSNIEWKLKDTAHAAEEIANSANPKLREFRVRLVTSPRLQDDCQGRWVVASPETAGDFAATAYYFGKALQRELGVPVGLIRSAWGGTTVQPWMSPESVDADPQLKAEAEAAKDHVGTFPAERDAWRASFEKWLMETARADRPTPDLAAWAAPGESTSDWQPVSFPLTEGNDLSTTGAIWLRGDVNIPPERAGTSVAIDAGVNTLFDAIYWNGELISRMTPENFAGVGARRRVFVPADKVKAGPNTIAIRFFQPTTPLRLRETPRVEGIGAPKWAGRIEFTLPALTPDQMASMPKPPPAPAPVGGRAHIPSTNTTTSP